MLRIRFHTDADDYRPLHWPIEHPYWCSGEDGNGLYSILISYADNEEYIYLNWPEATELDIEEVEEYVFTDRFPKPDWFEEDMNCE